MQLAWLGVNWFAILAAAVVCMVVGFLWYSPALFARPWMLASGWDPDDKAKLAEMQKGAGRMYGLAFVASLMQAAMLAKVISVAEIIDPLYGMKMGLGMWLGFVMTVQLTGALFGNQKAKLFLINTGYQMVCYVAMGALPAAWHPR